MVLVKNNSEAQRQDEEDHCFHNPMTQQSMYEALNCHLRKLCYNGNAHSTIPSVQFSEK